MAPQNAVDGHEGPLGEVARGSAVESPPAARHQYERLVCVTVGLPARGKTYISQKVMRYLNWLGITTRVFNVGNYRRRFCGAERLHEFFSAANTAAEELRTSAAAAALEDMIAWLKAGEGQVAIYDATNTTRSRRRMIYEACSRESFSTLFIESICNREDLIRANILEVKLSSPDYANVDAETAVADFCNRIRHYEAVYETLSDGQPGSEGGGAAKENGDKRAGSLVDGESEAHYSFVKIIDVGAKVILNHIRDFRQSQIVFFLMNLHIKPRSIFISRHGETTHNVAGRIGGDENLSEHGLMYARALPAVLKQIHGEGAPLKVWTSTLKRTIQTAQYLPYPVLQWKALDEIDAGVCDGLTYEEIEAAHPRDFAARDQDKFHFRYHGGESYADLVLRLEPIIMEVERQENILIIGHQAVLRAVLAYFLNKSHEELPYLKIPLHMLIQLTPRAYGCQVQYYRVGIDAVDTYRAKPGGESVRSPESISISSDNLL